MDLTGPAPAFTIRDIVSPYGILRDSIPLPGIVVQSMAESVDELQASFAPSIMVSPTMLTLTVDEGRGFGTPQSVTVTNNGIFGSLLDAAVTSDAPFIRVNPSRISNLGSTENGSVEITVDSTDLLADESPYVQTVLFQDPTADNNPVSLPVTVVVRPKAQIFLSPTSLMFYAAKPLTGPFAPVPPQSFMLSNAGPSASRLSYTVQKLYGSSPWLVGYTPTTGDVAGGAAQLITVTVAPAAGCLPGSYQEVLRVSGYSENSYMDVQVSLTIS